MVGRRLRDEAWRGSSKAAGLATDSEDASTNHAIPGRGATRRTGQPRLAGPACSGQRFPSRRRATRSRPGWEHRARPISGSRASFRIAIRRSSRRTGTYRRGDLSLRERPGSRMPQRRGERHPAAPRLAHIGEFFKALVDDPGRPTRRRRGGSPLDPQAAEAGRRPDWPRRAERRASERHRYRGSTSARRRVMRLTGIGIRRPFVDSTARQERSRRERAEDLHRRSTADRPSAGSATLCAGFRPARTAGTARRWARPGACRRGRPVPDVRQAFVDPAQADACRPRSTARLALPDAELICYSRGSRSSVARESPASEFGAAGGRRRPA